MMPHFGICKNGACKAIFILIAMLSSTYGIELETEDTFLMKQPPHKMFPATVIDMADDNVNGNKEIRFKEVMHHHGIVQLISADSSSREYIPTNNSPLPKKPNSRNNSLSVSPNEQQQQKKNHSVGFHHTGGMGTIQKLKEDTPTAAAAALNAIASAVAFKTSKEIQKSQKETFKSIISRAIIDQKKEVEKEKKELLQEQQRLVHLIIQNVSKILERDRNNDTLRIFSHHKGAFVPRLLHKIALVVICGVKNIKKKSLPFRTSSIETSLHRIEMEMMEAQEEEAEQQGKGSQKLRTPYSAKKKKKKRQLTTRCFCASNVLDMAVARTTTSGNNDVIRASQNQGRLLSYGNKDDNNNISSMETMDDDEKGLHHKKCYCTSVSPDICGGRFWCSTDENRCQCTSSPSYDDDGKRDQSTRLTTPLNAHQEIQGNLQQQQQRLNNNPTARSCPIYTWCPDPATCYCTNKLPNECSGNFWCNPNMKECACLEEQLRKEFMSSASSQDTLLTTQSTSAVPAAINSARESLGLRVLKPFPAVAAANEEAKESVLVNSGGGMKNNSKHAKTFSPIGTKRADMWLNQYHQPRIYKKNGNEFNVLEQPRRRFMEAQIVKINEFTHCFWHHHNNDLMKKLGKNISIEEDAEQRHNKFRVGQVLKKYGPK
eukprot:jgi/Bigna1/137543/aug1.39_g12251